uniref:O-phosphoseryl-tRNA(Sec) selenium transferase n=1 Tax=Aureoumbra lagunensis TaxID=44058 RepID=A0A7S3JSH7_9STRA
MFSSEEFWQCARDVVDVPYVRQAEEVSKRKKALVKALMKSGRMPDDGWQEHEIVEFLHMCAGMDSNNFSANVGVGEREGRVISPLVKRLSLGMAHGVGRSGDIAAVQPKAAGSSLIAKLANTMCLDALRIAGLTELKKAIILPCATGLSLALCLLSLKSTINKSWVIWLRIDQKSCLKAIALAGLRIKVIEPTRDIRKGSVSKSKKQQAADFGNISDFGDELRTDVHAIEQAIQELGGAQNILAIISTTSCFAPRAPDDVESVGKICAKFNIFHIINNAYGVQCSITCAAISRAQRVARVDLIIQSTDKNFLVPVGGAIIASSNEDLVNCVAKSYPGRASAAPCRDIFITLLDLGRIGWQSLLSDREKLILPFRVALASLAAKYNEKLLICDHNYISCAVSLTTIGSEKSAITKFGSLLFTRCCSGCRVVVPSIPTDSFQEDDDPGPTPILPSTTVAGITFTAFGASSSTYPLPYFTAAVALGVQQAELDEFIKRLDKTFAYVRKLQARSSSLTSHFENNEETTTPCTAATPSLATAS